MGAGEKKNTFISLGFLPGIPGVQSRRDQKMKSTDSEFTSVCTVSPMWTQYTNRHFHIY